MRASIIIRTLNEATHLGSLLSAIQRQSRTWLDSEVILVDSGSTDDTLQIAKQYRCKIIHISRQEFSFGRSLNVGCRTATGDFLVMISGHCVPTNDQWLQALCHPLANNTASYTYGRQVGGEQSKYSERQIFAKYYPDESQVPQSGIFCNNANSALLRSAWESHQFDEALTGLEDMELAQRLTKANHKIAYIAEACVLHYHDETWASVMRRFEREAIALQKIMPQVHIHRSDLVRYVASSIAHDLKAAWQEGLLTEKLIEIVQYRTFQYLGSYAGNHLHRVLSHEQKEAYFYPKERRERQDAQSSRIAANESQ